MLKASGCNRNLLDTKKISDFITKLVKEIDMVPFGEPFVARFGKGKEVGISAVQLIETSAIVMHTNDQARDMYFDVFSCKTFKEDSVIASVRNSFRPKGVNHQVLYR
jgi:S-adenosylmethionine/arginine decarboxylase-like enzyme